MLEIRRNVPLDSPEWTPYRTLHLPTDHWRQGIFVVQGQKPVSRLLQSRLHIVSVALPEDWLPSLTPYAEARSEPIPTLLTSKATLERLIGYPLYQPMMAVGRIPPSPSLESLLQSLSRPYLLTAVDGVSNPLNMGGIVRNCVAFGAQALLVGNSACSPYLRNAVRSAVGTVFQLPIVEEHELVQTLGTLGEHGIHRIAAEGAATAQSIDEAPLDADCCLLFGSEGHGIRDALRPHCDRAVRIPISDGVDSLNVATASAIFLYEVSRQRKSKMDSSRDFL